MDAAAVTALAAVVDHNHARALNELLQENVELRQQLEQQRQQLEQQRQEIDHQWQLLEQQHTQIHRQGVAEYPAKYRALIRCPRHEDWRHSGCQRAPV